MHSVIVALLVNCAMFSVLTVHLFFTKISANVALLVKRTVLTMHLLCTKISPC